MNYNHKRNNSKVLKTFKDYLFPIIIVFVILLFVFNYLFSSQESSWVQSLNNRSLEVSLGLPDTEAYSVYNGWNKTKIEWNILMYQTEKLLVVNGTLNIKDSSDGEFILNKLWELRYNEDSSYTLYSSDLWVKSNTGINIEMRYAKVSTTSKSVFSLSQNEVASTIYVVSWILEVQNLAGKSASLQKWEKLVIMRNNAKDENSDLSLTKEPIDDYIKSDDWFIKNNGSLYLASSNTTDTNTGVLINSWMTSSWSVEWIGESTPYILFNNLYDEAEINTDTIDIEGNIVSDMVTKIEINGQNVTLDTMKKTFSLKWFKLEGKTNNLIYRVYNESNRLLYKWFFTLYFINGNTAHWESTLAQVSNYPISTSPLYQILAPKINPYTTTDNIVRIEWTVPAWLVEKIIINDFELKKFPKKWSYWSYFANSEFWNLKDGVNIYTIQYFWAESKLIYENNFTIIKEVKKIENNSWNLEVPVTMEVSTWVTIIQ